MALPASGQISLSQVAVELGRASNATTSLGESAVRSLAGVPSGAISLNDLHGKANAFVGTITSNQNKLNLRTWALANGWNGSSAAIITVNSGIYIYSNSTSTPALTINGSWPGGITLVNNGYIMGQGGTGAGFTSSAAINATAGGQAISLGVSATINSATGYIGGGGGGGGAASYGSGSSNCTSGGGGAGGGAGGASLSISGGSGGGLGGSGSSGSSTDGYAGGGGGGAGGGGVSSALYAYSGGGGGRIMPGSGGAGAYGGGNGGSANAAGANGTAAADSKAAASGGGGGWGASGGSGAIDPKVTNNPKYASAAAGGKAVALNGYSVTWTGGFPSTHVFGAVS